MPTTIELNNNFVIIRVPRKYSSTGEIASVEEDVIYNGVRYQVDVNIENLDYEEDVIEDEDELEDEIYEPGDPLNDWPMINAKSIREQSASGLGRNVDWRKHGLLGLSGYKVGMTGIIERDRRRILNYVFLKDDLRDIDDDDYADEWGSPMTSQRLSKMARSIAAFANMALHNLYRDGNHLTVRP